MATGTSELSRLSRLVAILTQLQTKRLLTATELARRFAVSNRTIYRDIKALEEAGVPILTEEGRGYQLMDDYRLPPVMFTEQEANALITAEQLIQQNKDTSLVRDYSDAIQKIKAVLRTPVRDQVNLLAGRIKFYYNTQFDRTSDYVSTLQQALTHFMVVDIVYHSLNGDTSARIVEPFALLSTEEKWLLVAWCRLRGAYRLFRIDRIETLRVLQETFEPHQLTLREYFDKYGN